MIDWPLITSLVERWRPETHKFHVPIEEMMIKMLLSSLGSLSMDRYSSRHAGLMSWSCVGELLGVIPPADALK